MLKVFHSLHSEHDLSLVLLAALLCVFGSWVVTRLYKHALSRPRAEAIAWHFLTAITAGIAIWCTHFIAILAYQPNAPVTFNLSLTFVSLLIAMLGCTIGVLLAGLVKTELANLVGGAIVGLSISAMHYSGMIAYNVQGVVVWDKSYLAASVVLAVTLSAVALRLGSRDSKSSALKMTIALSLAIVVLHFTGMVAYTVTPTAPIAGYANPDEYKILALAIAGTASLIVFGGFFTHFVENRTRMESIEELRKARDAAESASRAKSEFMSVLSHELRTPLTIVIGYASFLTKLKESTTRGLKPGEPITEEHFHKLGDQTQLYGQRVQFAGDHLLSIINDILDYTSIELHDIKLVRTDFSMGDFLSEVEEQFQGLAEEKSIALHIEYDDFVMTADRGRCRQILINLVGNALKFSKARDICLRAKIEGTGVRFDVEDNGCGISADNLERIFQAFIQVENADNRSEGGTGLGLAICRKLAIAHGGDITVASTVGEKTTFTVVIPDCLAEQESIAEPKAAKILKLGVKPVKPVAARALAI